MGRSAEFPKGCDRIHTYKEFGEIITAFAEGHFDLLLLIGGYGSGKSKTIKAALDGKGLIINGRNTPMMIYRDLFTHKDMPVLIDDSESVLEQKTGKELLRSLCETDPIKELSWNTSNKQLDSWEIPRKFRTTSKVCIVCNRWVNTDSLTGAIQDRAHMFAFLPHPEEVHRYVSEWFDDEEILDWFGRHLDRISKPSARHYVKTLQQKNAGMDWRIFTDRFFQKELVPAELQEMYEDKKISRATYYRWKKKAIERIDAQRKAADDQKEGLG